MNKTIVYLIDEQGNKNFYLYDEDNGVTSVFVPVALLGRNVYLIDVKKDDLDMENVTFKDITIDNNNIKAWTFKDNENFSLIMVMNEKEKKFCINMKVVKKLYNFIIKQKKKNLIIH